MTKFVDGPAKDKVLALHRAAKFLRVVQEGDQFDALDQPTDEPKPTEKLFAYRITENPGMCHINRGRGKGGFYAIATYRLVAEQPTDEQMRDAKQWSEWCQKNDFKL